MSHPAAFNPNVVGTACCRRVRAAIGVDRCVPASAAHPAASRSSSSEDEVEGSTSDEHRRRVDDVLTRRPEVDIVGGVAADGATQLAYERLGGVSDRTARVGDSPGVVELGAARLGDPRCGVLGDEADSGTCRGKRALGVEHRLQPRALRHRVAQLLRHEDGGERGHTTKKVVCPSP